MFLGCYTCAVPASRVEIPETFRQSLSGNVYVTQGFERNLLVLPEQIFQEMVQQVTSLNIADPLVRLLVRMLIGSAAALTFDERGNASLPDSLREYAGLDRQAVLVGHGPYFEIWSPSAWESQRSQLQDAEANATRFAALHLALN